MTIKFPAPPTPKTHFEQIPVEVVKKIAPVDDIPGKAPAQKDSVTVPTSGRTGPNTDAGHFHGVQFYNDSDGLCRIVGGFLGEGVEQGCLAVIIATPDHTARIESCLRRRGADVDALKRRGHLVTLDARDTMQHFMTDGLPNPGAFRHTLGEILTDVRRGREHCTIRAYGEMVDLLWKDGREAAAIRLETLWNQLGSTHDFELLCGYSMGNFYKGAAIDEIKAQHSHLVDDTGDAALMSAAAV
jgi:MEDS: MEthanogen/methylotroph, DcmR Sensory domain